VTTYKDHVHKFGKDDGLIGIATVPDANHAAERPAVLLLNAGLVHRIGPFRLSVELARRLAAQHSLVFRIDQSALGDSAQRGDGLSYEERAVVDAKEAMDFLGKRYGKKRFIVMGLCAGAMNTHRVTVADDRVVGACLLDGYAYRTPIYWRRQLLPKLVNPANWARGVDMLKDKVRGIATTKREEASGDDDMPGADAAEIFAQEWPPLADVRRELDRVVARGTQMLFVYTGGWSDFVDERQFDEMFAGLREKARIRVKFFRDADHTYILLAHREAMLDEVASFVAQVR